MCWAAAGLFRCLFFEVIRQLSHLVNVYRNISTGVEGLPIFMSSTPIPYFFTQPCHCAINQVINASHHFSSIRTHKTNCWELSVLQTSIPEVQYSILKFLLYAGISYLPTHLFLLSHPTHIHTMSKGQICQLETILQFYMIKSKTQEYHWSKGIAVAFQWKRLLFSLSSLDSLQLDNYSSI